MISETIYSKSNSREIALGIVVPSVYTRILIMLHGHNGNIQAVNETFPLNEYAEKYHLLIVVPELGNSFYLDRKGVSGKDDYNVSDFLGTELPEYIKREYQMNEETEVILGGYSMGGFGAMLHGLNMPDKFSALISVSGAFVANEIALGSSFVVGTSFLRNAAFEMFMIKDGELPIDVLPYDSKRNPEAAVKNMSEEQIKKLPEIVLTCGEADGWCMTTHRMRDLLAERNISFWYQETAEGGHNFKVFDQGFRFAFDNCLKDKQF